MAGPRSDRWGSIDQQRALEVGRGRIGRHWAGLSEIDGFHRA